MSPYIKDIQVLQAYTHASSLLVNLARCGKKIGVHRVNSFSRTSRGPTRWNDLCVCVFEPAGGVFLYFSRAKDTAAVWSEPRRVERAGAEPRGITGTGADSNL